MLKNSFNQINMYSQALSASWLKNQAISNNIANVNTPNYKRETVEFEDLLKTEMASVAGPMVQTHANHMPSQVSLEPRIIKESSTSFRTDGNNVNIDTEMAELAENQLRFETITKQLNSNLTRLRLVISE